MKLLVLLIFLFAEVRGSSYDHRTFLDRGRRYMMYWKFNDTDITVKLRVATNGWIAWGVSPKGKMEASDFIIGWLDGRKQKHWHDMHGDFKKPTNDTTNDYNLISMSEEKKWMTVEFSRKLDLCSGEDASISDDTMRVVYAWGDKDPADIKSLKAPTKRHQGKKSIYLLDHNSGREKPTVTVETFDLKMTNNTLEAKETSKQCRLFKLPAMSQKTHLIRIEQNITIDSENLVRYMILYQCSMNLSTSYLGKVGNCSNADFVSECKSTPLHAWADGGAPFNFPKDAGLSLGTKNDSELMLLEIQYDNPDLLTNITDSSGFHIYYTKKLRKYDAGVLAAGIMDDEESMVIPPNEESFTSYGYCSSKCLKGIKNSGMKVFGSLLQANAHGKKIEVKLVRDSDGKETQRIAQDRKYDSKRRFSRYFAKNKIKTVLPGYSINVECTYDTRDLNSTIVNGLGSDDENCAVYLYYYPKIKTLKCVSRSRKFISYAKKLNWKFNEKTGRFLSTSIFGSKLQGKRVLKGFKSKDIWKKNFNTRQLRKAFQDAGKKENYDTKCYYAGVRNKKVIEPKENIAHKQVVSQVIKSCEKDIVVLTGASTNNATDDGTNNAKNKTNTNNKVNNTGSSVGRTLHEVMSIFSLSCVILCTIVWIN